MRFKAFAVIPHQGEIEIKPLRHGRWLYKPNVYDDSTYECSECGEPWTLIEGTPQENGMKYCPKCGAKMDEGEEDASKIL